MRQAITTRYMGPTDTKGGRVRASCEAGVVTMPWDHALSVDGNHALAATKLCEKLGWDFSRMAAGGLGNGFVYVIVEDA